MKSATQRDLEERILRVLVHVQTNLDRPLELDALARIAHLSPFHFHRVFRGMVGEPVMEHVRRLRLERAAFQLRTGRKPVTQIALDAGYETHEAFTRAFRGTFRSSPSQFRRERTLSGAVSGGNGTCYAAPGEEVRFQAREREGQQMNVRIDELGGQKVIFMRHVGPYSQVGQTWGKFMGFVFQRGLFRGGKLFAIVHDDPEVTPADKLRYDACIPAPEGFVPQGDVGVQEVAGGAYAIALHKGPYEKLAETYAALFGQWIPAHDREPAQGPCLEVYLNNPQQTPPEELLTEVCVPLRAKAGT